MLFNPKSDCILCAMPAEPCNLSSDKLRHLSLKTKISLKNCAKERADEWGIQFLSRINSEGVKSSLFVVVPVILIGFIHHFVRVAKAVFPKVLNFS